VLILWPEDHRFNLNHFARMVLAKKLKHTTSYIHFSTFFHFFQDTFWQWRKLAQKNMSIYNFSIMGVLLGVLLITIMLTVLNPLFWVILTTILIVQHKKQKKNNANRQLEASANGTASKNIQNRPPQPKNPMQKWNWLLYIGSFLVVLAMFYFVNSIDGALVAPCTIFITTTIYVLGIVVHLKIDYLRPVGKAFIYSALFMILFWPIAFTAIGLAGEIAPIISYSMLMIATLAAALLTKDEVMAHFFFISIISWLWSFCPLLDTILETDMVDIEGYFPFVPPLLTGALIAALYASNPKWLPDSFRPAVKHLGRFVTPITYLFSLTLFLAGTQKTPFLRTICAVFMLAHALICWHKEKSHNYSIMTRLAAQAVSIALTMDILKCSIFPETTTGSTQSMTAELICAIVWLLGFSAQILYALYAKKKDAAEVEKEKGISIMSFICIFFTPIFCHNLSSMNYALIWLTICLIVAGLGIAHAFHYKNVIWSIATFLSIFVMPLIFGVFIATPSWDGHVYLVCYAIIAALFLLSTHFLRLLQAKEANIIGAICLSLCCFAIILSADTIDMSFVGFFVSALFWTAFALMSYIKPFYEVAIYSTAIALILLVDSLIDAEHNSAGILIDVLCAHIAGGAFIGAQLLSTYVYKKAGKARFVIGYVAFSLIMTFSCLSSHSNVDALAWTILFLVEQVGALLYAVFKRTRWLIWFSSIEIVLIALELTSGMSYLWLGIIGIGLITFVIWQLSKASQNAQNKNSSN